MIPSDPRHIVILTGAGISAESGIRTFRDAGGLWEDHDILDVASPQGFERNPELVYRFYHDRLKALNDPSIQPNPAHYALAELEQKFSGKLTLITQNVDNLHERAGSREVIHMHGELIKQRCMVTGRVSLIQGELNQNSICPCCQQAGRLRPHIVWFGEVPLEMDRIEVALLDADLFLAIGTSGQVYPAAMFVQVAKNNPDCWAVDLNLEVSQNVSLFDQHIQGKASSEVPKIVQTILSSV